MGAFVDRYAERYGPTGGPMLMAWTDLLLVLFVVSDATLMSVYYA